jgi:hypothetical protein
MCTQVRPIFFYYVIQQGEELSCLLAADNSNYCIAKTKNEFGQNPEENIILIGLGRYYTFIAALNAMNYLFNIKVQNVLDNIVYVHCTYTALYFTLGCLISVPVLIICINEIRRHQI